MTVADRINAAYGQVPDDAPPWRKKLRGDLIETCERIASRKWEDEKKNPPDKTEILWRHLGAA